jgi:hypothetical protein
MNIESQRRMKIAQRNERARQMARDEIAWLNRKYRLQVYTFEHGGTQLSATFLEADDDGDEPNAYLIKLTAKTESGVTGQAYIIDSKGKRVRATAETRRHLGQPYVILRTLALP